MPQPPPKVIPPSVFGALEMLCKVAIFDSSHDGSTRVEKNIFTM